MPAPTFQNLGFEDAGAAPGLAEGWTLSQLASVEEIAGYGSPERPQEDFERGWTNDDFLFALAQAVIGPAIYDDVPESVEDFNEGWSQNEAFVRELASAEAADYDPSGGTKLVEDFDGLWAGNDAFLFAFAPDDLSAAPTEAFESGWRGNELFLFALSVGDVAAEPTETFESGWPLMATV